METSVDQLLDFDAAVRDIAEEPESPNMAPRTPEGSKPDMSAELRGSSMARVRGKTPHPPLEVI